MWEDRSADEFGEEVDQPSQPLLAPPLQLQSKSFTLLDQPQSEVVLAYVEMRLELRLSLELSFRPGLEDAAEDLQLLGVYGQALQA